MDTVRMGITRIPPNAFYGYIEGDECQIEAFYEGVMGELDHPPHDYVLTFRIAAYDDAGDVYREHFALRKNT